MRPKTCDLLYNKIIIMRMGLNKLFSYTKFLINILLILINDEIHNTKAQKDK